MLLVHMGTDLGIPLKKGNRKRTYEDIEHDLTTRLAELNSQKFLRHLIPTSGTELQPPGLDIDTDEEDASTPPAVL